MYNYSYDGKSNSEGIYSDLACERRRADISDEGVEYCKKNCSVGSWERLRIKSESAKRMIGRPMGVYDTLNLSRLDCLEEDEILDAQEEIARRFCLLCGEGNIIPARILVVGFGNKSLTPDSVGPKSAARIKPTLHISRQEPAIFEDLECSEIAVLCPGVSAICGMNSIDTVKAISDNISPDLIIAVDSISTSSPERLGSTVQLSDTGLFPGGMGNLTSPITRDTMGVPVLGIGVPTVMDSRAFGNIDYNGAPLFISPREIDGIVKVAAKIIGGAINQAFGI